MRKPASLSHQSKVNLAKKISRPVEVKDITEGARCTAAYIAELAGELALLANGARFPALAQLLARAQLEAELSLTEAR